MKKIILSCFLFFLCGVSCFSINKDEQAMNEMVLRLMPRHKNAFVFQQTKSLDKDCYTLSSRDDKIVITGNNANSMAVALNYYLKYYCNTTVSWYAHDSITVPNLLPQVQEAISNKVIHKNRFFLNYCTFGYSMTWWSWKDWERFIDWMALNGVNMPLAMTGQEAVWYRVWTKMGIDEKDVRQYFTGPAHLAWHRMSNLDYWQGNLPKEWLDRQEALQKRILKRERDFNMRPILPAFSGHVPAELHTIYPTAKISENSGWGGFEKKYRSHFLDPLDPLFKKIQKYYMEEQQRSFGTDHLYGVDPFNEVMPPNWDPQFLASCSRNIYESLTDCDPSATWVQMTWLFYIDRELWTNEKIKAYLSAVPKERMILLDYYCEEKEIWRETESFSGYPFIWCYLGNFGGNSMLAGPLKEVRRKLDDTAKQTKENFVGIGSTLEGLGVNQFMYEYVFEQAWEKKKEAKQWVDKLADRRLGAENQDFRKAWHILYDSVYITPAALGQGTLTNARPTLKGHGNWTTNPKYAYNNRCLYEAWKLMLKSAKDGKTDSYRYDLVNVGRQFLGNTFMRVRDEFSLAYEKKELNLLKDKGKEMLVILNDLDELLATHSSFLLGKWIDEARHCSSKKEIQDYYEWNARTILSTWGDKAQSLNDYANRSWAGLTKTYYLSRWELFVEKVVSAVKNKKAFDAKIFYNEVTSFELEWTHLKEGYHSIPKGNTVNVSKKIISKYTNRF